MSPSKEPKPKINVPLDAKNTDFCGVVVDGASIIHVSDDVYDVMRLIRLMNQVSELGWKVIVGLKEKSYYFYTKYSSMSPEDKLRLKELKKTNQIDLIRDDEDDQHLIRVALNGPYYLLARDEYKDWRKANPDLDESIEKCRMWVEFIGGDPSIDLPASRTSTVIIGESPIGESISLIHTTSKTEIKVPLDKNIGRNWLKNQCNLVSKEYISNQHFRLRTINSELMIEDLNSTNGTYIDNLRLAPNHPHPISSHQSFKIGQDNEFTLQ